MKLNGTILQLAEPVSLEVLLADHGYLDRPIAVERNGEIVSKAAYGTTMLQNEDVLEVVSFVGGG